MKPNYKLGNMTLKWDESWEEWHGIDLDGEVHCFRSLRAIKDVGGVAIETENKPESEEIGCVYGMIGAVVDDDGRVNANDKMRDWMEEVTNTLNRLQREA
jgi:hypothetical protein